MFTGLIQEMGRVVSIEPTPEGCTRIEISAEMGPLAVGESVAVEGACMSVTVATENRFGFDVMPESLARTTLGRLAPGSRVNLERALRLGDRLGGHFVTGHIDGVARVEAIRRVGEDHRLRLTLAPRWAPYLAEKGSVALAGVSLTVAGVDQDEFEVALIPLTLQQTTLGALQARDPVNLEVDLVARYLERLIRPKNDKDSQHE